MTATRELVTDKRQDYAFHDDIVYLTETKRGLTRETVEEISRGKGEPDWMLQFRLRAYDHFLARPMPTWGGDLDVRLRDSLPGGFGDSTRGPMHPHLSDDGGLRRLAGRCGTSSAGEVPSVFW